ncbi:polysaccharide pyruvyl transferase family protein [Photobacterium leiognathi subsp. mandapamensis]
MKKIGIITYHCVDNYGAVLQAYSLLDTTKKLSNMDVEIIDYRPTEITKNYSFSIVPKNRSVVKLFSNLLSYPFKKIKNNKFKKFTTDFIKLSNSSENISWQEYDYIITGSDQVWNPSITRLAPYYLNFPDLKSKKISYAASIGKDVLSSDEINYLTESIQFVDNISVREESAVSIVKNIYPNKNVVQVLDPVFLKSKAEWLNVLPKKQRFSDYILIYIMEYNMDLFKLAEKLAKQKNKKILIISPNANIKTVLKSINLPEKFFIQKDLLNF